MSLELFACSVLPLLCPPTILFSHGSAINLSRVFARLKKKLANKKKAIERDSVKHAPEPTPEPAPELTQKPEPTLIDNEAARHLDDDEEDFPIVETKISVISLIKQASSEDTLLFALDVSVTNGDWTI